MFPNFHDDIRIPTVGDDVTICGSHTITITSPELTPPSKPFSISVQPRSGAQSLSERGKAIAALVQHTHIKTIAFMDLYANKIPDQQKLEFFQVDIKNLLENYRSTLEYTAHFLAEYCNPKPPKEKIQFPIANPQDTEVSFSKKVDKWFPGLSEKLPQAKEHLFSIQLFRGESWLHDLSELTNHVKHRIFLNQSISDFPSLVIGYGSAKIRIGELGIRSLSILNGGILRFEKAQGDFIDISGPCELGCELPLPTVIDPRLTCSTEVLQLIGVQGINCSLPGAIWKINKNVYRTVDNLCNIASSSG